MRQKEKLGQEIMNKIYLKGLGHCYGDGQPTLKGLNFEIGEGERLAFVGPSGCGKTTLLRLLGGLLELEEGEVVFGDRSLPSLAPLGNLSLVFQDANLLPWRRVKENIQLPLELRGERIDEELMEEVLGRVGLSGCGELYPDELSGGMRMRVSLARAFLTRPSYLLLDEPFGALDEFTREKMGGELLRLWREDRPTTLLITHDISEAIYLSDRVIVMSKGPGPIMGDFLIEAPDERNEGWRESVDFLELRRKVSTLLRGET